MVKLINLNFLQLLVYSMENIFVCVKRLKQTFYFECNPADEVLKIKQRLKKFYSLEPD